MNKTIIFALGVVVGAVGGVLGTRGYFKKKYETIADEEIKSVKLKYKYDTTTKKEPEEVVRVNGVNKKFIDAEKRMVDYTSYYKGNAEKIAEMDLELDPGGPEDDDPDEARNAELREKMAVNHGIEVIDESDYGEFPHFDCRDMFYYTDGIIADENEEIVAEPDRLIGDISKLVKDATDDYIYIRNNSISADFCINCVGYDYGGDNES
ncbi:MAG TPA: hypothetical protein DCL29_05445 [Eubacterium sp.]|nr:hypothetical protein [Eubacterium sp.]